MPRFCFYRLSRKTLSGSLCKVFLNSTKVPPWYGSDWDHKENRLFKEMLKHTLTAEHMLKCPSRTEMPSWIRAKIYEQEPWKQTLLSENFISTSLIKFADCHFPLQFINLGSLQAFVVCIYYLLVEIIKKKIPSGLNTVLSYLYTSLVNLNGDSHVYKSSIKSVNKLNLQIGTESLVSYSLVKGYGTKQP